MTRFPSAPRYNLARKKAYKLIKDLNIHTFPIKISDIFSLFQISLRTYEFHSRKIGHSIEEIIEATGAKDGFTIYSPRKNTYKTIYNEDVYAPKRINWTLAHELGHILLRHLVDFNLTKICRNGMDDPEYQILETEANTFASELLCSPALINILPVSDINIKDISHLFDISYEASIYTKKKLQDYPELHASHSSFFRKQFYDFLNVKYCMDCHYHFILKGAEFCPICGSNHIRWGNFNLPIFTFSKDKESKEVHIMHYKNYPTAENGHIKDRCLRCGNEDLNEDFDFCPICGAPTTNTCIGIPNAWSDRDHPPVDGCGKVLPINARYCPYCGEYSSYFYLQLLPHWEAEAREIQKEEAEGYNSLPTQEEIPF